MNRLFSQRRDRLLTYQAMREGKTAQPDETDEVPFADVDVPVFEECSCPKCGAAVAADALFCGKCGEKLN